MQGLIVMYVPDMIDLIANLRNTNALGSIRNVMEIGAQEIFASGSEGSIERFIKAFRPGAEVDNECLTALSYGPARDLYRFVGCNYSCGDVIKDPDHRFYRKLFDLNFDEVNSIERERFDFVTNLGVSHHLLNQYNSFKSIHDFTSVNGFILHYLPFMGRYDDLYFYYEPVFFQHLAKINQYELMGVWIYIPGDHLSPRSFFKWDDRLWDYIKVPLDTPNKYYVLTVLFRKKKATDFCVPSFYELNGKVAVPPISNANFHLLIDLVQNRHKHGKAKKYLELVDSNLCKVVKNHNHNAGLNGSHLQEGSSSAGEFTAEFGKLEDLFKSFGYECAKLTPNGDEAVDFDNYKVSLKQKGTYDFVLNCGVSQNFLNQLNLFELIHDFNAVNGYMIHIVPFMGFSTEAYFCYETAFFEELAYANEYEVIGCWLNFRGGLIPITETLYEWIRIPEDHHKELIWICVVLKKMKDREFMIPFQGFYKSIRDKAIAERYVSVKSGQAISDDMERCIPRSDRLAIEKKRANAVTDLPSLFSDKSFDRERIIRKGFFQSCHPTEFNNKIQ